MLDYSVTRSQIVVLRLASLALTGNILEMQIIEPHSGPTQKETLALGPSNFVLTSR